jgi:hypothetical protein
MKEELRLIKQAIGTLQRAVAILEERLDVDTPKKQNGFQPPSRDVASHYHQITGHHFDFEEWWNHYTTNGWMVGKNKMKDWRSCMAQWEARHKKNNPRVTTKRYDAHGREIKSNGQDLLL